MGEQQELKACSFCGNAKFIVKELYSGGREIVYCEECGAHGPYHDDGWHWNHRPLEDTLKKQLAFVRKHARTIAESWDQGYGCVCEPIKDAVILCQVCKAAEHILKGGEDE